MTMIKKVCSTSPAATHLISSNAEILVAQVSLTKVLHHPAPEKELEHLNGQQTYQTLKLSLNVYNIYQSSSSLFCCLCIAFFLASRASARLPPKLGCGVVLRLFSELALLAPFKLIPESRCWRSAGFRAAAGRLAGGAGGAGFVLAGAAGASSST